MNKYIYLEFLTPIKDYITTLKQREFVFEWFVPFIVALLIYSGIQSCEGQ